MIKVAINGYGRIGRNVHRQFVEHFPDDVEVVAVNASSDVEMRAYLLTYDSLHRKIRADVEVCGPDMCVNGKTVRIVKERDPMHCPWKQLEVDVVIEATGKFLTQESAGKHIDAGAKKVIITAPAKDDTLTIVKGVNDELLTAEHHVISNGSCTTNCIAPIIDVIDKNYTVNNLLVSSVHAFTASQNLLDNKGESIKDLRRARAATLSMIPTKTGAVKACAKIFPHLEGKMDGMAFRVPVPTVSCAYMAFFVDSPTSAQEVNNVLIEESQKDALKDILSVCQEPLVSIDFQTDPHSSIVDGISTKVVDGTAIQILGWYDNEWGYGMRVTEIAKRMGEYL
jgi:glyceraldehyde 3-phosphate dehydrogenase